jgi:hypothetical protein
MYEKGSGRRRSVLRVLLNALTRPDNSPEQLPRTTSSPSPWRRPPGFPRQTYYPIPPTPCSLPNADPLVRSIAIHEDLSSCGGCPLIDGVDCTSLPGTSVRPLSPVAVRAR